MRARSIRLAALAAGVLGFQACAGEFPQSALHPASDFAGRLDALFAGILWWAVGVFVVVEGLLAYAIYRYRDRGAAGRPRPVHGNTKLEIAWTLAPALVLLAIAVPTVKTIFVVDGPPPSGALVVEAVGRQWWWEFRYPDLGVVTANEAHIPVGRPVDVRLRTMDVIHSFWVPRLGGKRDLIPGRETRIWLTARAAGVYPGQCAEYCGTSHAMMGFRIVVEEPGAFDAWVRRMRERAAEPPTELARKGRDRFLAGACIACHTVRGTPAAGTTGPDLTHVGSRGRIAGGVLENTPENMARWLRDPQDVKPGNRMMLPPPGEEAIRELVAYLESLR